MNGSKNLVFTSAGDKTFFFKNWLQKDGIKDFDLCVYYYGDERREKYKEFSDYYLKRKGSKLQNFDHFCKTNPEILEKYEYFFIMDDDIVIGMLDVNKMFEISRENDLWMCQPSLSVDSKCSYWFTKHNAFRKILYTNFCEINAPLFNRFAIKELLSHYDPILVGWGIDLMISQILSKHVDYNENRIAIINQVVCKNPFEYSKGTSKREIDKLQSTKERYGTWKNFALKNGYDHSFNSIKVYTKSFRAQQKNVKYTRRPRLRHRKIN